MKRFEFKLTKSIIAESYAEAKKIFVDMVINGEWNSSEQVRGKEIQTVKAIWIKCNGEAHSNPYIDNCGSCMPFWGKFPICPSRRHDTLNLTEKGYCRICKRHFDMSNPVVEGDLHTVYKGRVVVV